MASPAATRYPSNASDQSSPITNSHSNHAAPLPAPPPPPFEYLLEICHDLHVGAISPSSFAMTFRSDPSLIPPFKSLLPFLLSTDQFSLSAPLAKAILLLDDQTITSSLCYQPASLALAAFLFSLSDPHIPSLTLRTLRANAYHAGNLLQWPYIRSVVAVYSRLNAPQVASETASLAALNGIEMPIPPAWLARFDKWWTRLSPLEHTVSHILQKIQSTMENGYKPGLLERIPRLNNTFQEMLLSSCTALRADVEDGQNMETAEYQHTLLFLLTEKVLRNTDKVNWSLVSAAYAYLYATCSLKLEYDAWWASAASIVARVGQAKHTALARAMFVVPFLSPNLSLPRESLPFLLHHMAGIEGDFPLYGALSLSCRAAFEWWDDEFKLRFMSALLSLPSVAFQDVAASLQS